MVASRRPEIVNRQTQNTKPQYYPIDCDSQSVHFHFKYKSDVWLTVHRNSVWIRKNNQMSLFVFFISLKIVAQHVSGNHVLIIRSSRLRDVIALCWYVPWLQEGGQDRLAGSASQRVVLQDVSTSAHILQDSAPQPLTTTTSRTRTTHQRQ